MIYWFNPENDLALAAGTANYTPPRAAVALRRAGALLPSLWAGKNDCIFSCDITGHEHGAATSVITPGHTIIPWGWSGYTARTLQHHGAQPGQLHDTSELELMRRLSHRATASEVLEAIGYPRQLIPTVARDVHSAMRRIEQTGHKAVVKLPWSCSGRGVMPVTGNSRHATKAMIAGMIARQGAVTIEPLYDKINDFAVLYHRDGTKSEFRGVSFFKSGTSGQYTGNIIAPQSILRSMIGIDLGRIIPQIAAALDSLLLSYTGWVGVDMLTYRCADGRVALAPCIEVNLRMTMGVAALLAYETGRLPWETAVLRVAMPHETMPHEAIPLSLHTPAPGSILESPTIIAERLKNA